METETSLLQDEIATLEKIYRLGRLEPDPAKIEASVQERLDVLQARFADDPAYSGLEPNDIGAASGEAKALLWALGRDRLEAAMRDIMQYHAERNVPNRTELALPNILLHTLEEAPDEESRASAAYEIGKLRVIDAIPALTKAMSGGGIVAQLALQALTNYTLDELIQAGLHEGVLKAVEQARAGG